MLFYVKLMDVSKTSADGKSNTVLTTLKQQLYAEIGLVV